MAGQHSLYYYSQPFIYGAHSSNISLKKQIKKRLPETVVPPFKPLLMTYAKSLLEVLIGGIFADPPKISKSLLQKPTLILPFIIPIVAGIDPY